MPIVIALFIAFVLGVFVGSTAQEQVDRDALRAGRVICIQVDDALLCEERE